MRVAASLADHPRGTAVARLPLYVAVDSGRGAFVAHMWSCDESVEAVENVEALVSVEAL